MVLQLPPRGRALNKKYEPPPGGRQKRLPGYGLFETKPGNQKTNVPALHLSQLMLLVDRVEQIVGVPSPSSESQACKKPARSLVVIANAQDLVVFCPVPQGVAGASHRGEIGDADLPGGGCRVVHLPNHVA